MRFLKIIYCLFFLSVIFISKVAFGQSKYVIRDIKTFGAKGDGKTNDYFAFINASNFFNKRKGNGKLVISKGVYLINSQKYLRNDTLITKNIGESALFFKDVNKFEIFGKTDSKIVYQKNQKFGTFNPETGLKHNSGANFFDIKFYVAIGSFLTIENAKDISISGLNLDGKINEMQIGGEFGDTGWQIAHDGIYISNSENISLKNIHSHHFGRDGLMISKTNNTKILNCNFEYNGRQGFSWIGGSNLLAQNSKFNYTGKNLKVKSAPGAGVDIEPETDIIRNGSFINCEFIDNVGCAMLADVGDSKNFAFKKCVFKGVKNWSLWAMKPQMTYDGCQFFGSIVNICPADNKEDGSKFISCKFYNDSNYFGNFAIEVNNNITNATFLNCTIHSKKSLMWFAGKSNGDTINFSVFENCQLIYEPPFAKDYLYSIAAGGVIWKNTTLTYKAKKSEVKKFSTAWGSVYYNNLNFKNQFTD